jgi:NTE family protein
MDLMSRILSPYDLNPLGLDPLRDILAESIDFDRLSRSPIKLFVTPTMVRTGRGRIFRNAEITADVLLASACLPTMFRAIEVDGEAYWDGGYAGNPTITPLVRESEARDVILVQINPNERPETPRSASEILNRLNEVSFNSALAKELRMIALLRQVADPGSGEGARWAQMRTHRVYSDLLTGVGASSKLNAEWDFVAMLRDEGRRAAGDFLDAKADDLGQRSTADLDILLQSAEGWDSRASLPDLVSWSGSHSEAGAYSCSRRLRRSSLLSSAASLCSLTGRRFSWAVPRAFWRSSFRCFCLERYSAS